MRRAASIVIVAAALTAHWSGVAVAGRSTRPSGAAAQGVRTPARFGNHWIDLSKDWGAASACAVIEGLATRCFRTARDMDRWVSRPGRVRPVLNCSTPLKLHDKTKQMGALVSVYARGLWVNLDSFSFDNRTSSYTVGLCSVDLAPQSDGGGNHYTRCLAAGCVENTMLAGWDNTLSSVYLH